MSQKGRLRGTGLLTARLLSHEGTEAVIPAQAGIQVVVPWIPGLAVLARNDGLPRVSGTV